MMLWMSWLDVSGWILNLIEIYWSPLLLTFLPFSGSGEGMLKIDAGCGHVSKFAAINQILLVKLVISMCFCWIPNFETSLRFPGVIHGQDVLIRVNGRVLISFAGHSRKSHSLLHWSSCVLKVFKGAKIGTVALHQHVLASVRLQKNLPSKNQQTQSSWFLHISPKRMGMISTPLPCGNQGDDSGATEGGRTLVDPLGGICQGKQ